MFRKLIATTALCMATAPAGAAVFTVNFDSAVGIPPCATCAATDDNEFKSNLNALGLNRLTNTISSLTLSGGSSFIIEWVGAESLFNDIFEARTDAGSATPDISFTKPANWANNFAAPVYVGSLTFGGSGPVDLTNLLRFVSTSPGALTPAGIGTEGFAAFLTGGEADPSGGSYSASTLYIAYDDQLEPDDDNHDDLVLKLTAVPEPATWAMLLSGFAAVGAAMRRRSSGSRVRQAV